MKNKNISKIDYEPEADVLTLKLSGQKIDYAKEVGNFVIHFTEKNIPVLIEILEATSFLKKANNLLPKSVFSTKMAV